MMTKNRWSYERSWSYIGKKSFQKAKENNVKFNPRTVPLRFWDELGNKKPCSTSPQTGNGTQYLCMTLATRDKDISFSENIFARCVYRKMFVWETNR